MTVDGPKHSTPHGHSLLAGRKALVTAAAGTGIGFATARRLAEEGASVIISDIHEARLEECAQALREESDVDVMGLVCDVTDQGQVDALFTTAVSEWGHLDVVVNNAGLGGTSSLMEMTDEAWHRVIDVTLTGTFRCMRAALGHMVPRRSGAVINVSSVLGWRAQREQAHYAAAKAGVMALTRCAAMEAAPSGVRVNSVAPSLAMHEHLAKVTSESLLNELERREAFGRAAEPDEIANVIVFLASDLASYMTGEVVSVSNQHP